MDSCFLVCRCPIDRSFMNVHIYIFNIIEQERQEEQQPQQEATTQQRVASTDKAVEDESKSLRLSIFY